MFAITDNTGELVYGMAGGWRGGFLVAGGATMAR